MKSIDSTVRIFCGMARAYDRIIPENYKVAVTVGAISVMLFSGIVCGCKIKKLIDFSVNDIQAIGMRRNVRPLNEIFRERLELLREAALYGVITVSSYYFSAASCTVFTSFHDSHYCLD